MADLAERALEAHRQYLSRGRLPAGLLRERTRRAWERSHLLGANARKPKAEHLGAGDTERLLQRESWLIEAARPYLRLLSRAAGADRHAAMLGDADSVVLDTLGDEHTIHGPEPYPAAGALLDESAAGSNGIGTPLAEGAYAELVGPEHFIEGFHLFICQGVPVRDAAGRPVGVVGISVRRPEAAVRLRALLVCAANGVEAELVRRRLEEDVRRVVQSGALDEPLVEKLRQDIVQSQAAARLRAEAAARGIARNQIEEGMRLLDIAERSIASFRRQAALWRELSASGAGPEADVALHHLTVATTELMRTEAATRNIDLSIEAPEPSFVRADTRAVARALFRVLLHAFDLAGGGGAVRVRSLRAAPGVAQICVHATPPPGEGAQVIAPLQIALPLSSAPIVERARDAPEAAGAGAAMEALAAASDRARE